jgi:Rab-GTPase-TBC domain
LFETNLETLHAYFTDTLQLHPSAYLDRFVRSIFALYMPLDILARVWDIFVFEGDKILLCTTVAVLAHFEMGLYEDREAVLLTLTAGGPWDLGKVDVFIKRIADIREK